MATAGNITAVLTLNASRFNSGLKSANTALDTFKESMVSFDTSSKSIGRGIAELSRHLQELKTKLDGLALDSSSFKNFNNIALGVKRVSEGLIELGRSSMNAETGINIINSIFQAFGRALNNVEVKVKGVSSSMNQMGSSARSNASSINQVATATTQYSIGATNVRRSTDQLTASLMRNSEAMRLNGAEQLRNMGYTGRLSIEEEKASASSQKLATTQQQVANATRQSGTAMNTMGASAQKGTSSMNAMATSTNKLQGALYSLIRVGRLVAIMFGYQIAYQFLHATTETISARSEMENYFRMLKWGQADVNDFNNSLGETVKQFQRINKYSLGETITSIGVEFDLSKQEMKEAMPVVSMITSEYMRAGRTADEASLAVKDILQGQFQRLSRETGVGESELIEAGWSGDVKDTVSLLKALQKIGKARHWDEFASKAHSLGDAIQILQNRFGEWSADMVNVIQPSIVNAFNSIMEIGGSFANMMGGIWKWLNTDGIAQSIIKWGGLGTAIVGVVGSLISFRTGANLVQVAHMGLTKTILATTLGLNAEATANYGVRTAITSKILGLKAETVAQTGVTKAIGAKLLGLDAEMVAQYGVKGAIASTIPIEEAETLAKQGNVTVIEELVFARQQEMMANRSSLSSIIALIAGVNMETFAEHGLATALVESTTAMNLQRIATMGLAEKMGVLAISIGLPYAVVGAFVIALGSLTLKTMEATKQMAEFNKYIDEGDDIINNITGSINAMKEEQDALIKSRDKYVEGSAEYIHANERIEELNNNIAMATLKQGEAEIAIARARRGKQQYEEGKLVSQLNYENKIVDALQEAGVSYEESRQLASAYLRTANDGSAQLYQTLQKINYQYDLSAGAIANITKKLEESGKYSPQEIEVKVKPLIEADDWIISGKEKRHNASSITDVVTGWIEEQYGQISHWWTEFTLNWDTGDIFGAIQGAFWGIVHGLAKLPIFSDFWNWIWKATGLDQQKGKGWDGLWAILSNYLTFNFRNFGSLISQLISKYIGDIGKSIMDGLNNTGSNISDISHMIADWIGGGIASFTKTMSEFGHQLYDAILGLPQWIMDGINYIGGNISEGWNNLWKDFKLFDDDKITELIGDPEYAKQKLQEWLNSILEWFGGIGQSITAWFNNTGSNISDISHSILQWIIDGFAGFSEFALQIPTLIDTYIIQPISTGIMNGLMSIPFVTDILQMLGLVDSTEPNAKEKGAMISTAIRAGIEEILGSIPILGDILKILGVIPQASGTASANGAGVGNAIKTGLQNAINNLSKIVSDEFWNAVNNISNFFKDAWDKAYQFGKNIVDGVKSALHINSPGIVHDLLGLEFGTYTPQAIDESGATAFASAQQYGQQVIDGVSGMYNNMPQVAMDFFTNGALSEYQTDANTVTTLSSDLSLTTVDAFNSMQSGVNTSVSGMASDVTTQYMAMQQNQNTMMTSMQNANLTGYRQMNLQTNQQLLSMRNETQQVTTQMIGAWSHMKTQLVATANALRNESTAHFNALSSTIGSFYRKIQNPANWGGASSSGTSRVRTKRNPTAGRKIASSFKGGKKYAGGSDLYNGRSTMTVQALKRMICPNGNCDLFDGYNMGDTVNVMDFLMSVEDGAFGWNNWKPTHYNYIKNKSDQWNMKSPQLLGRINTNANFKVGDFENGTPKISFGSFQSMAESLFSAIPYKMYYNSDWKGSWLGAIQAGACNCWDGAHALLAFANTCGFSGSIAHGSWNGVPHVWAVIEGRKMDTTGWQQRGTWTPSASAGGLSSSRYAGGDTKTYNISINIDTIYGEDDFEKKMRESAQKVMREEFNDPYTIPI